LSADAAARLGKWEVVEALNRVNAWEWLRDRRAVYGYCLGGGMHRAAGRAELLFERS